MAVHLCVGEVYSHRLDFFILICILYILWTFILLISVVDFIYLLFVWSIDWSIQIWLHHKEEDIWFQHRVCCIIDIIHLVLAGKCLVQFDPPVMVHLPATQKTFMKSHWQEYRPEYKSCTWAGLSMLCSPGKFFLEFDSCFVGCVCF